MRDNRSEFENNQWLHRPGRNVGQAQERLGREMNPVVMRKKQFLEAKETGDRFVQRLMREPRLLVIGDAARLEKELLQAAFIC